MKRSDAFRMVSEARDPVKDHAKILANLHYTHFFLMEKYKFLLAPFNLTLPQSNVLGIADFFGRNGAALEDIKELILEPNSDVSRTVTRLVEKGFLEKLPDPKNRRKVLIRVTESGNRVLRKLESQKLFETFTANLTKAEVSTLVSVLNKLRSGT